MSTGRISLTSDNASGAHPEVVEALVRANEGHCASYGEDPHTEEALRLVRSHFGERAEACFVFNGTGANVVALRGLVRGHEAVLCAESSHLWQDECGAPERFLGAKIVPIPSPEGKLAPAHLEPLLDWRGAVHHAQPAALSITQATEWGTVYQPSEIRALVDFAREHGLRIHMDGARLANAAAHLDLSLAEIASDLGIDALSFGGTKNGLLFGEAVVFPDPDRIPDRGRFLGFHRKQATQLASKMRFLSAQIGALLSDDLWLRSARRANAMARRLEQGIAGLPGLEIVRPVEANALFVAVPEASLERLREHAHFHVWDPAGPIVRWMTSFDTRPEEIDRFVERVRAIACG